MDSQQAPQDATEETHEYSSRETVVGLTNLETGQHPGPWQLPEGALEQDAMLQTTSRLAFDRLLAYSYWGIPRPRLAVRRCRVNILK